MGFLTILNYFAMGVGYIILLLGLIIVVWLLISSIKEKIEMKKWEKERVDEEERQKILEKEKTSESTTTPTSTPAPSENNKEPAMNNNEPTENKEKLVDESGKIKMVG